VNIEYVKRDLSVLWHPCTQMKDHETFPPVPIKKGNGVWIEDMEGNLYLDAISSWWVNLFGHCHPVINAAIKAQLEQLEHVLIAGFTHEPVIKLSEHLVRISPAGLDRCFYADNGSSAIEVALKMSFHYWRNKGQHQKTKFISLDNSYHGETLGALSVGNVPLYRKTYAPLLLDTIIAPSPDCFTRETGVSWEEHSREKFTYMKNLLAEHADRVCAVVIEPLVQCAGYMRMYDPIYLRLLKDACNQYDVHLIADEIAVGFGRTGTMFACEHANISPDFMCLSKGLTAGYLPLAVTLTTNEVYQAFYDDYTNLTAFLHSHSYTGNPLGCSAALATLDIFTNENVLEKNRHLSKVMHDLTADLQDHPNIAEVRQHGMILAMEIVKDKKDRVPFPWQERRGLNVYQYALSKGVLLRPLGDVIYLMPPYVITPEEIALVVGVAREGINQACK
jgi:adenosylmethionine---8-amino-7-oxononanoate aminotransferase